MKDTYLERVPEWYKSNDNFELVLSDDIDSLVTTGVLKMVRPNWDIDYFYDFNNVYINKNLVNKENKSHTRVWCDVAIIKNEMAFDNHISRMNIKDYCNSLCINPNILANVSNYHYTDKYAGSTALLVWSLYNIPLPTTEEGKMLLLAIDSTFLGYYGGDNFRSRNRFFLCDVLGLNELYEVEKRHTKKDFYQLIAKYTISRKIKYNSETMKIETELDIPVFEELLGIKLPLPDTKDFVRWASFEQRHQNLYGVNSVKDVSKRLFTLAFTHRNDAKYSLIEKVYKPQ